MLAPPDVVSCVLGALGVDEELGKLFDVCVCLGSDFPFFSRRVCLCAHVQLPSASRDSLEGFVHKRLYLSLAPCFSIGGMMFSLRWFFNDIPS